MPVYPHNHYQLARSAAPNTQNPIYLQKERIGHFIDQFALFLSQSHQIITTITTYGDDRSPHKRVLFIHSLIPSIKRQAKQDMNKTQSPNTPRPQPPLYEIRLQGHLATRWANWFENMTVRTNSDGTTTLNGSVTDQATLHGLLRKVRDLGLPLISVNRLERELQQLSKKDSKMNILIVGATGATGRLLVTQLLDRQHHVKAIVRSAAKLPAAIKDHPNLTIIQAAVLDLSDSELAQHVKGCDAVASCLGHNLTFKGIYGHPRRLVTDATRRLCQAIKANKAEQSTKFVLMNTTGNRNGDLHEPISFAQKCVIGLLRLLLPPHVDNEQAAEYLRTTVGQKDHFIEWTAVRPDGLIDVDEVTPYQLHPSPTRSAIFDAGQVSRINVAHFMAELITADTAWQEWKGRMPVIYSTETA